MSGWPRLAGSGLSPLAAPAASALAALVVAAGTTAILAFTTQASAGEIVAAIRAGAASLHIGAQEVAAVIEGIAAQTNLLALNAAIETARSAASEIGRLFEQAIAERKMTAEDIFDRSQGAIPDTDPPKCRTRHDAFADEVLPEVQERVVGAFPELVFAITTDPSGYVPTHDRAFSRPLTGNRDVDLAANRTKRVFDDATGSRRGSHTRRVLVQTCKRDTGEVMHDLSVPVHVAGRHRGGLRIGYRPATARAPATQDPTRRVHTRRGFRVNLLRPERDGGGTRTRWISCPSS